MTVSVVIPHRNRADLLQRALASVAAQRLPPGHSADVIVVDNGSVDRSAEVAQEHGARTVRLGTNRGVSHALNRGIERASGDWILLLNNDVVLAADWIAELLAAARRSGAWFATGKIYDDARRHRLDGAGDAVCRGAAAWRLGHGRRDGAAFSASRPTYFPSATASLFRREFFSRAGCFDESFFAYLEDVELGMRAAALGLRGIYVPGAEAWHRGSETGGRWSDRSVAWITRHQLTLVAKHYSEEMLLRFGAPLAVAQILWLALAASRGKLAPWLRGIGLGLADLRSYWRPGARSGDGALSRALCDAELEIASFQAASGWDAYWRWYFRLVRPDRRAAP